MNVPVKVVIAEPSVIIRSGLISVLRGMDNFRAEVFEVPDLEQLRDSLAWHKPGILMINPGMIDVFSIQKIKKDSASTGMKLVALQASFADSAQLKNYDEVISVYDSSEQIREKIMRLGKNSEPERRYESLSAREKEVIVCVIKGMTNKQIADKLCLSTHTVITHRRNISNKLQIHSTAGLTIYAIVNKLVELDDVKDISSEAE